MAIGAESVGFGFWMKPDGKTEEHGFLVVAACSVPLPYGAPVETGTGTTVAVLTVTSSTEDEASALPLPLPAVTAATSSPAGVGMAV